MSLKTVFYDSLSFPCSRHGVSVSASAFSARMLITSCSVADLVRLQRPADPGIRDLWMSRFVNEMHWLPLIETLIGCDRLRNPTGNAAFLLALEAADPLRVCHRPWGKKESLAWAYRISQHIRRFCPDPRIYELVQPRLSDVQDGGDVFFVSNDCEPPATQSQQRGKIWVTNSWVLYRHTHIGIQPSVQIEKDAIVLGQLDPSDIAAQAYKATNRNSP